MQSIEDNTDHNDYFHEYQDLDDQTISDFPVEEPVEDIQRPTNCMKVFIRTVGLVSLIAIIHGTIAICTAHDFIIALAIFCMASVLCCIETMILLNIIESSKSAPFGVVAAIGDSSKTVFAKCLIYITNIVSFVSTIYSSIWLSDVVDKSALGYVSQLDTLLPVVTFVFSLVLVIETFVLSVYSCFRPGAIFGELPHSWQPHYGLQALPFQDDAPLTIV